MLNVRDVLGKTHVLTINRFHFEGRVNRLYCLTLSGVLASQIKLTLRQNLMFELPESGGHIAGCLMSYDILRGAETTGWVYTLSIQPRLSQLAHTRRFHTVTGVPCESRLAWLFLNGAIPYKNQLSSDMQKKIETQDMIYGETDLLYFLSLREEGVQFVFLQKPEGEVLMLLENIRQYPHSTHEALKKDLRFQPLQPLSSNTSVIESYVLENTSLQYLAGNGDCYLLGLSVQLQHEDLEKRPVTAEAYDCHNIHEIYVIQQEIVGERSIEGWVCQNHLQGLPAGASQQASQHVRLFSPEITRAMPGYLLGGIWQKHQTIGPAGEHAIYFPHACEKASQTGFPSFVQDIQGVVTREGGATHAVTLNAELLLSSQNGRLLKWLHSGAMAHAKNPNLVHRDNEHHTHIQTRGGVNFSLSRQSELAPIAHTHMGVTDPQGRHAMIAQGARLSPQEGVLHQGLFEASTGFALSQVAQNYQVLLQDTHQGLLYQKNYAVSPGGQTLWREESQVDSISERYYPEAQGRQIQQPPVYLQTIEIQYTLIDPQTYIAGVYFQLSKPALSLQSMTLSHFSGGSEPPESQIDLINPCLIVTNLSVGKALGFLVTITTREGILKIPLQLEYCAGLMMYRVQAQAHLISQEWALTVSFSLDPVLQDQVDHFILKAPTVGEQVLPASCSSCHIREAQSNEVFNLTLQVILKNQEQVDMRCQATAPEQASLAASSVKSPLGYVQTLSEGEIFSHRTIPLRAQYFSVDDASLSRFSHTPVSWLYGQEDALHPNHAASSTVSRYMNQFEAKEVNQPWDSQPLIAQGALAADSTRASQDLQYRGNYDYQHQGITHITEQHQILTESINAPSQKEMHQGIHQETWSGALSTQHFQHYTRTSAQGEHQIHQYHQEIGLAQFRSHQETFNHQSLTQHASGSTESSGVKSESHSMKIIASTLTNFC